MHFLLKSPVEQIVTPRSGVPIPDEQNGKVPEKTWKAMQEIFISHSDLKERVDSYDDFFLMGGMLDACLGNCMDYFARNYVKNGERLYCLSDLSVIHDYLFFYSD